MMKYERGYYNGSKSTNSNTKLPFSDDHPGCKVIYMKEMKHVKIPIISVSDGFPDIETLKIGKEHIPMSTNSVREDYARKALILFYPFRNNEDLLHSDGTFWSKFEHELKHCPTNKFLEKKDLIFS